MPYEQVIKWLKHQGMVAHRKADIYRAYAQDKRGTDRRWYELSIVNLGQAANYLAAVDILRISTGELK